MPYKLTPLNGNLAVMPLNKKEIQQYSQKVLLDVETSRMAVLSYGRVISVPKKCEDFSPNDIILYQKLASHVTNFGDRQILVPVEQIEGKIEEIRSADKETEIQK